MNTSVMMLPDLLPFINPRTGITTANDTQMLRANVAKTAIKLVMDVMIYFQRFVATF